MTFAKKYPLLSVFLLFITDIFCEDTIRIHQGRLQGSLVTSVSSNTQYHSFKGIPYAQPPIKTLRFQPPKPHSGWEGVLNATKHGSVCPQINDMHEEEPRGEEDCLFLNVYTPKLKRDLKNSDESMPVMFWIHGGFFRHGSGNSDFYNPDYFMDEDVVVVTSNYRLGVLGFLDLEDDTVTGNMGMKDIVMALNWVQKNIKLFGGDPEKVTIFGSGSGGVAVDLLTLSPMAKGLFHKAICQSGVSLISSYLDWGPRKRAINLATKFRETSTKSKHILQALMKADAHDLATNLSRTVDVDEANLRQIGVIPFSPSVDKNSKQPFMPQYPEEIFESGEIPNPDVSMMIGFNSQESIYHSQYFVKRPHFLRQITKRFQYLFPLRGLHAQFDSDYFYEISYRLKHAYFTNGTLEVETEDSMDEFLTFNSDLTVYPVDKAVKTYVKLSKAPIYYYRFSYDGGLNYFKALSVKALFKGEEDTEVHGASEMDEICYLFKCEKMSKKYKKLHTVEQEEEEAPTDLVIIKRMVRLWTNFARSGDPTPENDDIFEGFKWEPAVEHWQIFLDINENMTSAFDPHYKNINFWNLMYEHYTPLATNGVLIDPIKGSKENVEDDENPEEESIDNSKENTDDKLMEEADKEPMDNFTEMPLGDAEPIEDIPETSNEDSIKNTDEIPKDEL